MELTKRFKFLLLTEKGASGFKQRKYMFSVPLEVNKLEIKSIVEKTFSVSVETVNTLVRKPKKVRKGKIVGLRKKKKIAYVMLKDGFVISEVEAVFNELAKGNG